MQELPPCLFDIYALALPRGHGFGDRPPTGAWGTADGGACGIITCDVNDGSFGILVMRRRRRRSPESSARSRAASTTRNFHEN